MRRGRSLIASTAASVLLVATMVPAHGAAKVVATGSVTCTKITGTITYRPAMHHVGTSTEVQTFSFTATHCTTKGSNVKRVISGTLTTTLHRTTNACATLLASEKASGVGHWKPASLAPTRGIFSGYHVIVAPNGDVGFALPNLGGSAHLTGSFAGRDHGRSSHAALYLAMTGSELLAACNSSAGLSRQTLAGGSVTFS